MTVMPVNSTGWSQLIGGSPLKASIYLWHGFTSGYFIFLLFIAFISLVAYKTKSPSIVFLMTSLFVVTAYATKTINGTSILPTFGYYILTFLIAVSGGFILYFLIKDEN